MNRLKLLIAIAFPLAFAIYASAQDKIPKIVWKNLQEKYESFYDIKPIIINVSDNPIYFECSLAHADAEYLGIQLLRKVGIDSWQWNVFKDGVVTEKSERQWKESQKKLEKLRKEGKYIPKGCKLNPNEEFTFNYDSYNWDNIIKGDGIVYQPYKSGKFKFRFPFEWYEDSAFAESPEFLVTPKEQIK